MACIHVRKVRVVRVLVRGSQGTQNVRMPGVEPGPQSWEACVMPLQYMRHCFHSYLGGFGAVWLEARFADAGQGRLCEDVLSDMLVYLIRDFGHM